MAVGVGDAEALQAAKTSNRRVATERRVEVEATIIVWYSMLQVSGVRRGDEVGVGVRIETDGGEIGRGHQGETGIETELEVDVNTNVEEVGVESESATGDGGRSTIRSGSIGGNPSVWRRC